VSSGLEIDEEPTRGLIDAACLGRALSRTECGYSVQPD